jgi:hypothetical protein
MSERILMKFIVGQRVIKQGEDSRFRGRGGGGELVNAGRRCGLGDAN